MKITVITGSPHRKGTSALLADEFIRGAKEAGHSVVRFDAAFEDIHPCRACDYCITEAVGCVQKDALTSLISQLVQTEMIVFVTPLYYFGMSAQIKTVIDRFYAVNTKIMGNKKTVLLATAEDDDCRVMKSLEMHYQTIIDYLCWEHAGKVLATGCKKRKDIENTNFPQQAYLLGKSV